jgi:methylated-DNA-[protein]-cysteine S-methyltransferase
VSSAIASGEGWKYRRTFSAFLCRDLATMSARTMSARTHTTIDSQISEYFIGKRTDFDLPMRLTGTLFQQRVWAALREIPYGEVLSYGALAQRIGQPGAARAVGLANGKNPISIIVPCHRVVGSTGLLTGYGGGLERKQHLLDFERRISQELDRYR